MSTTISNIDPNVFHHDETYRGQTTIDNNIPPPPPTPPPPPSSTFITSQPSQSSPASYQPVSTTATEPERCSLYVPCPKNNCNQPGCEGCVGCDSIFTCTREECEVPLPHELERGMSSTSNYIVLCCS